MPRLHAHAALSLACLLAGCASPPAPAPAAKSAPPPAPFVSPSLTEPGDKGFSLLSRPAPVQQQDAEGDPATLAGGAALRVYDYPRAVAEFSKALAVYPTNVSALCGRALAYSQIREFQKAQADYDAALACADPARRTDILVGMSYFHMSEKRFDLALADIDECVKKGGAKPAPASRHAGPDQLRGPEGRGRLRGLHRGHTHCPGVPGRLREPRGLPPAGEALRRGERRRVAGHSPRPEPRRRVHAARGHPHEGGQEPGGPRRPADRGAP